MNLILVTLFTFIFNIPFGYWRANVKKFSLQWVLAIHLPIPFIIFERIFSNIGFALYTYPVLIAAFFIGQFSGSKLHSRRLKHGYTPLTSCLFMDIIKQV